EGWSSRCTRCSSKCVLDTIQIVSIRHADDIPSVSEKAPGHIFSEGDVGLAFDGDVIVVVNPAEVVELQVPRKRSCLARDALHRPAIAAQCVHAIVEQVKVWLVVSRCEPLLSDRHSDACGDTLSQRTGGCLDAGGPAVFGVSRAAAAELPEGLEVIYGDR